MARSTEFSEQVKVIARRLGAKRMGGGWTACCPAHKDRKASLVISEGADGKVLLHCFAGCTVDDILSAAGLQMADLFGNGGRGRGMPNPGNRLATLQQLTLADYAVAKQLPIELLAGLGLSDVTYMGRPAVRIPYRDADGSVVAARFRLSMTGDDRFRWKTGDKPLLYGLNHLAMVGSGATVYIVEGESCAQTLWHHGYHAVGVPGAANWKEERDAAHLVRFSRLILIAEPDAGGDTLISHFERSMLADRVAVVRMPEELKDASALHCADPGGFSHRFDELITGAVPLSQIAAMRQDDARQDAFAQCGDLAGQPDILSILEADLTTMGLVGETRIAKLLYLAVTSRLLERPLSVAVKGPSSGGKSFVTETVLQFFPGEAFYALSAMSDKALAYGQEPLRHRMLVIYEASGMASETASYLIRSLLSEGRVRYETVNKTAEGLEAVLIEREGPTGLLVTTTALNLHPENETRLISVTVTDTREQTKAIFRALAGGRRTIPDMAPWHGLQSWLATAKQHVEIPFAEALAELVPAHATRLRRDFSAVLTAIRAHALLHNFTRGRDEHGNIVATIEDYRAVRELLADVVSQGVEATVSVALRQTVAAVKQLIPEHPDGVPQACLVSALNLDKSAVSRRLGSAQERGYLVKLEGRGNASLWTLGTPLPEDMAILPLPDVLLHSCAEDVERPAPLPPIKEQEHHGPEGGKLRRNDNLRSPGKSMRAEEPPCIPDFLRRPPLSVPCLPAAALEGWDDEMMDWRVYMPSGFEH